MSGTFFATSAKPCPFCGYPKMAYNRTPGGNTTWVVCYKCEANGPFGNSPRSALIRWNKRKSSELEKLSRAYIDFLDENMGTTADWPVQMAFDDEKLCQQSCEILNAIKRLVKPEAINL